MLSQSHILCLKPHPCSSLSPNFRACGFSSSLSTLALPKSRRSLLMSTTKSTLSNGIGAITDSEYSDSELDHFADVGNKLADAAGNVIRKYFRTRYDIFDKEDSSPVTVADRAAEASMVSIIQESLPSHAIRRADWSFSEGNRLWQHMEELVFTRNEIGGDSIFLWGNGRLQFSDNDLHSRQKKKTKSRPTANNYGEENGWQCKEKSADYVWVLDPIDGTKSFITGKPLFGTLIALLDRGKPILGIIDQPVLRERWVGVIGRTTRLNGEEVSTRSCPKLSHAYLYTTSPHLFSGDAEVAFARVRDKVKVPLYGCDCYAYALLASGHVDLVIESGLKPYDFLALIPVIEGAGGVITDWKGNRLRWEASPGSHATSFNVVAAGDKQLHQQAMDSLSGR